MTRKDKLEFILNELNYSIEDAPSGTEEDLLLARDYCEELIKEEIEKGG